MSVLRAEIRQRLGDRSIYDGVVEYTSDFNTDPFLESVHYGSLMICLNLDEIIDNDDPPASDVYVKREDGSWELVVSVNQGKDGKSAYEVAVDNGYVGTEQEWLASLEGAQGVTFTPSVSQAGVISWTNDGGLQNPTSVDLVDALATSGAVAPFLVTFSKNSSNVWVADKTISQVGEAYADNRPIFFVHNESAAEAVYVVDGNDRYYVAQTVCKETNGLTHYKMYLVDGYGVNVTVTAVGGGSVTDSNAVHYTADSGKSDSDKAAARSNIDAEPKKFVVTVTANSNVYTADKTLAEIYAAHTAGKTVIVTINDFVYPLVTIDGTNEAVFSAINGAISERFYVDNYGSDDEWTFISTVLSENPLLEIITSATPSFSAGGNTIYDCRAAACTSLTISNSPNTGDWSVRFVSGSTATTLTVPNNLHMPDGFAVEANMRYEINVSDQYALCAGWPTT